MLAAVIRASKQNLTRIFLFFLFAFFQFQIQIKKNLQVAPQVAPLVEIQDRNFSTGKKIPRRASTMALSASGTKRDETKKDTKRTWSGELAIAI